MKKNLYIQIVGAVVLCLALTGIGYGQGGVIRPLGKAAGRNLAKNEIYFSGIGQKVKKTYQQACLAQERYSSASILAGPSKRFVKDDSFEEYGNLATLLPRDIYPKVSALSQPFIPQYFLIKQNQEFCKWIPTLDQHQELVHNSVPQFKAALQEVKHPGSEDMRWLAGQTNDKTDYLLLGEMHGFSELTNAISKFLLELRARQPNREILLFTEFLPEDKIWGKTVHSSFSKARNTIWRTATTAHIPVIGLEPEFVIDSPDATIKYRSLIGKDEEWPVWATIEGARLRNGRWLNTLRTYRQKYPNALFVIYAGNGHIDYAEPYSIGKELVGGNTLVVEMEPRVVKINHGKNRTFTIDDFDALTLGAFPQRILWFSDPVTAQLAGFDIRIKIPTPSQY